MNITIDIPDRDIEHAYALGMTTGDICDVMRLGLRRRVTRRAPFREGVIERPSSMVILAARHLDETEGPCREGHVLTPNDRSAITTVLRYISAANTAAGVAPEEPKRRDGCRCYPTSWHNVCPCGCATDDAECRAMGCCGVRGKDE